MPSFDLWAILTSIATWIATIYLAFLAIVVFLFAVFLDDFPLSIFTFSAMGYGIGAAAVLFATRLVSTLNSLNRLVSRQPDPPLSTQLRDIASFGNASLYLIATAYLGALAFAFSFGPYVELLSADKQRMEQLAQRGFFETLTEHWTSFIDVGRCAAWHVWKGIPESLLGWLDWVGITTGQSARFAYSCGGYFYDRYSQVVAFLVNPLFFMALFALWKAIKSVVKWGFRLSPKEEPQLHYIIGWGDRLVIWSELLMFGRYTRSSTQLIELDREIRERNRRKR